MLGSGIFAPALPYLESFLYMIFLLLDAHAWMELLERNWVAGVKELFRNYKMITYHVTLNHHGGTEDLRFNERLWF